MRFGHLVKVLILVAAMLVGFNSEIHAQTSSNDAPYIYYYSPMHQAVVVERADGSDSRLIGTHANKTNDDVAATITWSPSGKWLAWLTGQSSNWAVSLNNHLWIESTTGQRVTLLDNLDNVQQIVWSPKGDQLAVAQLVDHMAERQEAGYEFYVIDVPANHVIASFRRVQQYGLGTDLGIRWSFDGQRAFFYYSFESGEFGAPSGNILTTISLMGQVQDVIRNGKVSCGSPNQAPYWASAYGAVSLSVDGSKLNIEGSLTNDNFDVNVPDAPIIKVVWRPDGQYALVMTRCDPRDSIYLLSIPNRFLKPISTYARVPDQNNVSPENLDPVPIQYWSPDGSEAIFATGDAHFNVLDPVTSEVQALDIVTPPSQDGTSSTILQAKWINNDQLGLQIGESIYQYQLSTKTSTLLQTSYRAADFSSDLQNLAFVGSCNAVNETGCIEHISTDTFTRLMGRTTGNWPAEFMSYPIGFRWHPTQDWLFMIDNGSATETYPLYGIASADGKFQRDIADSWGDPPDWLPSNVSVAALPHTDSPANGRPLLAFSGSQANVTTVAWSPNGSEIASGSWDGKIRIWQADTGQLRLTLDAQIQKTIGVVGDESIVWNRNGSRLLTIGSSDEARLWANDGTLLLTVPDTRQALFNLDGSLFALAGPQHVEVWQTDLKTLLFKIPIGDYPIVAFSPDGKFVAVGDQDSGNITLWDAHTGERRTVLTATARFQKLLFSPDGLLLASTGYSSNVSIWNVETGALFDEFEQSSFADWLPDSRHLIADFWDKDGTTSFVYVRDVYARNSVVKLQGAYSTLSLVISPDGRWILGKANNMLTVWNAHTGQIENQFYGGGYTLAWSPDSKRFVTGSSWEVKIWPAHRLF